jgi:deazaflavin-dependent oxidoreductase (nitroreductase family)
MTRRVFRLVMSLASTRPGAWFFLAIAPHVDRLLMRASGGRFNTASGFAPVLLLETTGRKSGKLRTAPLLFLRDHERYVVIASKGGHPKHPDWYFNLRAKPQVKVVTGGRTIPCTASEAAGAERASLWKLATDLNPAFDKYQQRAGRRIPVIVLTPERAAQT